MKPSIGRIVHYELTPNDANKINSRRARAQTMIDDAEGHGVVACIGNIVQPGERVPLIITAVWPDGENGEVTETSLFNGQAILDGNDSLWVTSTKIGDGPRECQWPPRT